MEEKYKERKGRGLRDYFSPLTMTGSAFGAGTAYLLSFPISMAHNFITQQLPNISDGNIIQRLHSTVEYGFQTGGEFALIGGIAGLVTTVYARDWVKSLFGRNKR